MINMLKNNIKKVSIVVVAILLILIIIIYNTNISKFDKKNITVAYLFGYDKAQVVLEDKDKNIKKIKLHGQYINDFTNPIKYNKERNSLYTSFYDVNPNKCKNNVDFVSLDDLKVKEYNFKDKYFCNVVAMTSSKDYLYVTSNLNGKNTLIQLEFSTGKQKKIYATDYVIMDLEVNEGKLFVNAENYLADEEKLLVFNEDNFKLEKKYDSSKMQTSYTSPKMINGKIYSLGEYVNKSNQHKKLRITDYKSGKTEFVLLKDIYPDKIVHHNNKLYITHSDIDFEKYITTISIYDIKTKKVEKMKTVYMPMMIQIVDNQLYSLEMSDEYGFDEAEVYLIKYDLKTKKVISKTKSRDIMPRGTSMLGSIAGV